MVAILRFQNRTKRNWPVDVWRWTQVTRKCFSGFHFFLLTPNFFFFPLFFCEHPRLPWVKVWPHSSQKHNLHICPSNVTASWRVVFLSSKHSESLSWSGTIWAPAGYAPVTLPGPPVMHQILQDTNPIHTMPPSLLASIPNTLSYCKEKRIQELQWPTLDVVNVNWKIWFGGCENIEGSSNVNFPHEKQGGSPGHRQGGEILPSELGMSESSQINRSIVYRRREAED